MKNIIAVCTLIFSFFIGTAFSADYYVSNSGNDSNQGTSETTAWKTIGKVNGKCFETGDTIHFQCGDEWQEQLNINKSCNVEKDITFTDYGNDCDGTNKPVINAGMGITGWTRCSDAINGECDEVNYSDMSKVFFSDTELLDNYITNGTFDSGHDGWSADLAGTITWVDGGDYLEFSSGASPSTLSSTPFSPQKSSVSFRNYNVYLKARAETLTDVQIIVENSSITAVNDTVTVGTEWETLSFSFHLDSYNFLGNAQFKIVLPANSTISIDDISIKPEVNQLFVSDTARGVTDRFVNLAQHPNSDYYTVDNTGSSRTSLTDSQIDILPQSCRDQIIGSGIFIRTVPWQIEGKLVSAFDDASNTISWDVNSSFTVEAGDGYYIYNKLCMLDSYGEWFYDEISKRAYLIMPEDMQESDPTLSSVVVETSHLDFGIYVRDQKHTTIENLEIEKPAIDGVSIYYSTGFHINNIDIHNSGHAGIYILHTAANQGTLSPDGNVDSTNCILGTSDDDAKGIIENSDITGSLHEGIRSTKLGNLCIKNNTIENSGTVGTPKDSRGAIHMNYAHRAYIGSNNVRNSGYNGITFARESIIEKNVIEDSCMVLDDCGALYTWNGNECGGLCTIDDITSLDSIVTSNIIDWDSGADPYSVANGIYLDNSSNGVEVSYNTVANVPRNGININSAPNNIIHHNTVYGSDDSQLFMREMNSSWSGADFMQGNTVTNNILFPLNINQPVELLGDFNNIDFGVFDENIYGALYSEEVVYERYRACNDNFVARFSYTLPAWQLEERTNPEGIPLYQDTLSTSFGPFSVLPYTVVSTDSSDYIPGGAFDASSDVGFWSTFGGTIGWEEFCNETGGCLKFESSTTICNSHANGGLINLHAGKTYKVRFRAKAAFTQSDQSIRVVVRTNDYQLLLLDKTVSADSTNWKTFEFIFDAEQNYYDMRLDYFLPPVQGVYLDDISLVEVTVADNDTSDDSRILINKESVDQDMACPDIADPSRCNEYIDLELNPVSWPVTLSPYSSRIIVWGYNPFQKCTDNDNDGYAVEDWFCGLVDPDDTDPSIVPISDLVAFPHGNNNKIKLEWTCSAGATGYDIYRGTVSGGPYELIKSNHQTNDCNYNDNLLGAGGTYYYIVNFINAQGQASPDSNEAYAVLP